MTGTGVGERIRDGYSWLSNRYRKGDEVFLVGYSRGAFIARSVGGMISKYGLMKECKPTDFSDQANPKEDPNVVKLYEAYKAKEIAAVSSLCLCGDSSEPTNHRLSRTVSLCQEETRSRSKLSAVGILLVCGCGLSTAVYHHTDLE